MFAQLPHHIATCKLKDHAAKPPATCASVSNLGPQWSVALWVVLG